MEERRFEKLMLEQGHVPIATVKSFSSFDSQQATTVAEKETGLKLLHWSTKMKGKQSKLLEIQERECPKMFKPLTNILQN